MTVNYSTNWCGPISMDWFRERGLTANKSKILTEDSFLVKRGDYHAGDVFEYEDVTTYYSGGRIDIYGVPGEHYPLEYGVAPMHGEDWNALSDWLDDFETGELIPFEELIEQFEADYGKRIRWAEDTWYRCWECGLVTDLRETKQPVHKLDCTRNWKRKEE